MSALRYFEDFTVGEILPLGETEATEADLIAFARRYDPQPFHLDPEAGRASLLGGLAGSGWHACALGMRLFYQGVIRDAASLGAPGIADCRWLKPLLPSERAGPLEGRLEIVSLRPSGSRPEMGFVGCALTLLQRAPEAPEAPPRPICAQRFEVMIRRRAPGAPAAPKPPGAPRAAAQDAPEILTPAEALALEDQGWEALFGKRVDLGETTVSAEEIVAFAQAFDPQPFHLSEEGGRASLFGGLCASGWHTTAMFMGRLVRARAEALAALAPARQAAAAMRFGPSTGFTDLNWLRPVRPGDRLRWHTTAHSLEPFGRRPEWRLLRGEMGGENQQGRPVLRFRSEVLTR